MAWTLCTSGAAIAKAGANANSTIVASGATLAEWSNEVEGTIATRTRQNWSGAFSTINSGFKSALSDVASDLIAMKIISYDMSSYTSRLEAQTMLDVLRDNALQILIALDKDEYKEKLGV